MSLKKKRLLALIFLIFFHSTNAFAGMNVKRIIWIESKNRAKAHNTSEDARGLMQIRNIVLQEWNNYNPQEIYTPKDLFTPQINIKIGTWYLEKRCPQMLKYYKIYPSVKDVDLYNIACYNWGIGNVIKWHKRGGKYYELPKITRRYYESYVRP